MLNYYDLVACLARLPKELAKAITEPEFAGKVFIAGGFVRAIVAGEPVNDIDVFVSDAKLADQLTVRLLKKELDVAPTLGRLNTIYTTDNAYTLRTFSPVIQIIRNRTYKDAFDIVHNFDFSVVAAAFYWHATKKQWASLTHGSFYKDLAAKRLCYLNPSHHDNAAGSLLRVLKFYKLGYHIPVESLSGVLARLAKSQSFGVGLERTEYALKTELIDTFRAIDGKTALAEVRHIAAERLKSGNSGGEEIVGERHEPMLADPLA